MEQMSTKTFEKISDRIHYHVGSSNINNRVMEHDEIILLIILVYIPKAASISLQIVLCRHILLICKIKDKMILVSEMGIPPYLCFF